MLVHWMLSASQSQLANIILLSALALTECKRWTVLPRC